MAPEKKLKQLMARKNIKASKISKDLKIPENSLSYYFSGQKKMPADRYLKIKAYLDGF